LFITRIVELFALGLSLVTSGMAIAQTPAPAQAPPSFSPPLPHVNAPLGDIPRMPGDGNGAYKTHQYRDLFADLGHSPAESRAKIDKAFQQLFHGDGQEERLYFETGVNANGPLAYITDWANNDARSEGMSYGMMIAVQLDKKREFDAIWNWANTYMLITDPKNPSVGYFAWSMNTDGTPRATGAAPDGEEYFVMALYFAAHRWGNGQGIYNYQAEAGKLLRLMRHHPVLTATGPFRIHPDDPPFIPPDHPWPSPNNKRMAEEAARTGKPLPFFRAPWDMASRPQTIGPMVDEDHFMIRFIPDVPVAFTDPSYHLPAFYELWARWGPPEDREFWAKAADVSRDLFSKVTGPRPDSLPIAPISTRRKSCSAMEPRLRLDTIRGAASAIGQSIIRGGRKTRARPRSATAFRNSFMDRASTTLPIVTRSMASHYRHGTPSVWSPPPR
jgi:oligosaccharide reducing-end xylanase